MAFNLNWTVTLQHRSTVPSIRALESKANVDSGVSGRCTCWSVYMTPDSCTHVVLSTVPEGLEVSAVQRLNFSEKFEKFFLYLVMTVILHRSGTELKFPKNAE